MKIATWNVNSLKVRLSHVQSWLNETQCDVLCLQELKMQDKDFPVDSFTQMGFQSIYMGQKTYNGVAILLRNAWLETENLTVGATTQNIPSFDDEQKRLLVVELLGRSGDKVTIVNGYFPNGQSISSDKYRYKLDWLAALTEFLAQLLSSHPNLVLLGDFNIAPTDLDVHAPELWQGKVLVSEPERAFFQRWQSMGLVDAFRIFPQEPKQFSWWDYRQMAFRKNNGLRIDHILLSQSLVPCCKTCKIDREPRKLEQPSDHAPVWAQLDWPLS